MKNNGFSKVFYILTIAILLLSITSLTGCDNTHTAKEPLVTNTANNYKVTDIEPPVDFIVNSGYINGSEMCILGIDNKLFTYDFTQKQSVVHTLSPYNDGAQISLTAVLSDSSRVNIEYTAEDITLNKLTADGTKDFSVNLIDASISSPQKMLVGDGDIIYIADIQSLTAVSSDGMILYKIPFDMNYIDFNIMSNGKVFVKFFNTKNAKYMVKYIDIENQKIGDNVLIPKGLTVDNIRCDIIGGAGFDLYYRDTAGIYGYNYADNEAVFLLDWAKSGIDISTFHNIYIKSQDEMVFYGTSSALHKPIHILAEVTDEPAPDLPTVTIGYMNERDKPRFAATFNRKSDKSCIIELKYYEDNYNLLNADIAAGNTPDILVLNNDVNLPVKSYIEKGVFTDIYKLIDNDKDISRDDFSASPLKCYETDGKLYRLCTGIIYNLFGGKTSNIGKSLHWSYSELAQLKQSLPGGVTLDRNMDKYSLAEMFIKTELHKFVDYQAGTCRFDSSEFIDIINSINMFDNESLYDTMTDDERSSYYDGIVDLFHNDKLILTEAASITEDILSAEFFFGTNEVTFKGFPTASGGSYNTALNSDVFAISEQSKHKAEAWEFLKFMLSDNVQVTPYSKLPVTKSGLNEYIKTAKSYHYYIDVNGNYTKSANEMDEIMRTSSGFTEMILKDEHFKIITDLLSNYTTPNMYDNTLAQIVNEELTAFFSGASTAEDTVKLIQNRVSVYLSEIK